MDEQSHAGPCNAGEKPDSPESDCDAADAADGGRENTDGSDAGERLEDSVLPYRMLFENAGMGIGCFDLDGRVVAFNRKALQYVAATPQDVAGKTVEQLFPQMATVIRERMDRAVKDRQTGTYEDYAELPGGTRWFSSAYTPIIREDGAITGIHVISHNITALKIAEQQTQETHKNLQGLIDACLDSVLMIEPDGTVVECNEQVAQRLGCTREQLIGSNAFDHVDPEVAAERRSHMQRVLDTGRADRFVDERLGRVFDNNVCPIKDEQGKVVRLAIFGKDITEQRHAESELTESEARFRMLYEGVQAGIVLQRADGVILHANRVACEVLGMSEDEITSRTSLDPVWQMVDADGEPVSGEDHPSMVTIRTGEPLRNEVRGLFAGDKSKMRWLLVNTEPVFEPGTQRLKEVMVTFTDITEQKRAEEALRYEYHLRNTLLDNVPCIALILKKNTREIVACNEAARQAGAMPGMTCFESMAQLDGSCPFCLAPELWQTNEPHRLEVEHNGRFYEGVWVPLSDDEYVHYIFDKTEAKLTERKLEHHRTELAHVWRVNTMGEIASGLAHEINQPLCAVQNYAATARRLLQAGFQGTDKLDTALEGIATQTQRAGRIIRTIRSLVGKHLPRRENLDVNEVLSEVVEMQKGDANALSVQLSMELADNLPMVDADKIEIEQVLLNLVRNALDAMSDVDPGERSLNFRTEVTDSGKVCVHVCDSGKGLPEDPECVFDSFYTTKEDGLGIGLSLSRTIIEAHGGRLTARSNPAGGASFAFTLPPAD